MYTKHKPLLFNKTCCTIYFSDKFITESSTMQIDTLDNMKTNKQKKLDANNTNLIQI